MIRAITIREPQIARVTAGTLTRLRRPIAATTRAIAAGDLLWVREPFHLPANFDGLAPTVVVAQGVLPVFATEIAGRTVTGLGMRRFARNLPKSAHRQHLRVLAVAEQRLQAITEAEARAEGFASRKHWAGAWDANLSLTAFGCDWSIDPTVLAIDFERIAAPVPAEALA